MATSLETVTCGSNNDCASMNIKGGLAREPAVVLLGKKTEKSVSFRAYCDCLKIPHVNDFSQEDIEATWFQEGQYAAMVADNDYITALMMTGTRFELDDPDYCVRGLEYRMPEIAERRRNVKEAALAAVLDEQDRQWAIEDAADDEFMAELYREVSGRAANVARFAGLNDAQEASRTMLQTEASLKSHPKKRSVTFNPSVNIRHTIHINETTTEEIMATWYQKTEYDIMKAQRKSTIRCMMSNSFQEDDEFVSRGLERALPRVYKKRRDNKFIAVCAVLDEQFRQENEGTNDPELLARLYQKATAHCAFEAQHMGHRDEIAIAEYVKVERASLHAAELASRKRVEGDNFKTVQDHDNFVISQKFKDAMLSHQPRSSSNATGRVRIARTA